MALPPTTITTGSSARAAAPWLAPAAGAVVGLVTLLWSLPRGLDLSDEGYYLTEIAHPGDTTATALLFGWAWHPLYAATGGSVIGLRVVAFALVAVVSVSLTHAAVRLGTSPKPPSRATSACLYAVATALAFVPLSSLPATPSHNTLAWMSLAIAALGCALAWSGQRSVLGGVLVGIAGFAAATAKPTTALVLAVAVLLTTPWRQTGPRPIVAATATLSLACALLVALAPGHLDGLVDVVRRGVEATVGHTDLIRRDPYPQHRQVLLPLAIAGTGGAWAGLLARRHPLGAALVGGLSVAVAGVSLLRWIDVGLIAAIDAMLPFAALTGFGVLGVASAVTAVLSRGPSRPDSLAVRLAVLLAILPAAYAIGTNNNLWHWAGQTVFFWFLAIVLIAGVTGPIAAAAGGLAAYTALVSAVITPLDPYRSGPLVRTEVVRVSQAGATMRLPPEAARATTSMLAVGHRLGVTRATPILDLTGVSPGVVWAWGGRPAASGWLIGGYPESVAAARIAVAPSVCDLPRTLLLWGPGLQRAIPDDVLAPWGVSIPADYRPVATFPLVTQPATGSHPTATVETVTVLEPVTVVVPGCTSP